MIKMRRVVSFVLASLLVLGSAGMASAANHGPHPQPPKCVPANTPGCS